MHKQKRTQPSLHNYTGHRDLKKAVSQDYDLQITLDTLFICAQFTYYVRTNDVNQQFHLHCLSVLKVGLPSLSILVPSTLMGSLGGALLRGGGLILIMQNLESCLLLMQRDFVAASLNLNKQFQLISLQLETFISISGVTRMSPAKPEPANT